MWTRAEVARINAIASAAAAPLDAADCAAVTATAGSVSAPQSPRRRLPLALAVPGSQPGASPGCELRSRGCGKPRGGHGIASGFARNAASVPEEPDCDGPRDATIGERIGPSGRARVDGTARNGDPGGCATCHNGATAPGQAVQASGDFRVLRHLPPDDGVDPRDLRTHRRHAEHLRVLPQRYERQGQAIRLISSARGPATRATVRRRGRLPTAYRHLSPAFKPHTAGVKCVSCHTTNGEAVVWKSAAFKPDCAGCHANAGSSPPCT